MPGKGKREREGSKNGSRESPVHLQRGAGNITGALRREERDGRGQLFSAAHAPQRNARHQLAHHLLGRPLLALGARLDRKSTRLNSSHTVISYAVFCLKKKKKKQNKTQCHQ